MNNIYIELASQLLDVEKALRKMNYWSDTTPSPSALASTEPFAVDALDFIEWLQFIFLPRMHLLIKAAAPLPLNCGIAPMAEEYFKGLSEEATALIASLKAIDTVLSGQDK
ncbi:MAG: YqcC family protein [Porticoccus sp.]